MGHQLTTSYLAEATAAYVQYKSLAEAAVSQIADEQLTLTLDPESNSIAHIMKHLAGNLRSRWTDFLTTDGEKPDRNRDAEFESTPTTRAELLEMWEGGWKCVFAALESLSDADLARTVHIRSQPHSVMQAINRNLTHSASHVGQIILLAKHFQSDRWKTLSMPRRRPGQPVATLQDQSPASTTKSKPMRFVIIALVSSLAAASMAAQNPIPNQPNPPFFGGDKGKKDKGTTRPVHGVVKDNAGAAVPQAIVELKNLRTGKKIGTVTHPDGTYRFDELNVKDDYELHASHEQLVSPVRKLSMYDSRKDPVINFDLDVKKDAQPDKQ